jgi:hypothetical protein
MATSNYREAKQAIRAYFLEALNDVIDPKKIAWENRPFNPPDPTKAVVGQDPYWIQEDNSILVDDLIALHLRRLLGVTTFYILYPVGKGTERIEDLTQIIADAFEKKSSVTFNSTIVGFDKVERNTSEQADNVWWRGSVSIYWRTYTVATSPLVKS